MGPLEWMDALTREVTLFAAAGLLVGGVDDLMIDLVFIVRWLLGRGSGTVPIARIATPRRPGRIAVFVGAWDESAVIGPMLTTALARFEHDDYAIYVGTYPNDRATIDAVAAVAERDSRARLVIGPRDGPTTKADNLNALWRALRRDEAASGVAVKAVVLHDAEDVVHPAELRLFDALIEGRDVVQLPVLPLVKRGSPLVSGHYADEFAECHGRQLVVRSALRAGLPLAGTGCAIAPAMLARIAAERGGEPFDSTSLTEDYELGLRIAALGGRSLFARVVDRDGLVAVRAFFPDTLGAATRQKARWMAGIALAGWDRTGWARARAVTDHWMRMRDRRALLSVLVLAAAYAAVALWGVRLAAHAWTGAPVPRDSLADWLVAATTLLLWWRLAMRFASTARTYGWRQGWWSLPRFFVGNYVSLAAAPLALARYWSMLRGHAPQWDKTSHAFPELDEVPAA